jgi:hypothetical protein
MARRVSTKTGASAPSKGFKIATGKGRGGAAAGPGSRKPAQKPQVVAFNESTVQAINDAGPKGHEVAHINPREGRLLEALGGSGEKDPETNIKSYETVGKKTGKKTKLPKGEGRGRFPGYEGDHHQVAVLTDPEVEALNTLRYKDKDRGFVGGFGPEIQALADQNDRPFEFLEYRGEKIPTLNGGGDDDDQSGDEGESEGKAQINETSGGNSNFDWTAYYAGLEEARIEREEKAEKAEKKRKEDLAKEKKEALEAEQKIEADLLAGKIDLEKERLEKKELRKATEKAEKEEAQAQAEAEAEAEAEAAAEAEEQAEAEAQAEIEAEAEQNALENEIETEYENAEDRENILEGSDDGQGDLYEDLDGMLEEPTESSDRGDHGTVGADGTVYYDTTGEEGKNYFKELDKYYSGDAYNDPDFTGLEPDSFDDSDEGFELTDNATANPHEGIGDVDTPNPPEDEPIEKDAPYEDPSDDTSWEGLTLDDSETVDEELQDYPDIVEDTTTPNPHEEDPDTPNPHEDDPGPEPDTPNPHEDLDGTSHGGIDIIPGDDPITPDDNNDDDPNTGDHDVTTDLTEDEEVYDPTTALGKLQAQYKKYGETDYEKLYHDEFSDDLAEDYGAATKGLDFNFLTSGDRSEFNTAGDTVNDQQNYLGELLEGDQQDDLNTQARNYASNPTYAINKWYKDQQAAIEGGATEFEELDLSEWADPSENYNPEFFGDEGDEGEILYDKRYYDPDKTYYDDSLATPTFQSMGTDDPEPIVEPIPGTPGGDEMIMPETIDPSTLVPTNTEPEPGTPGGDEMIMPETISDTGVIGPATDGLPPGTTIAPGMFDTLEEAPIEMGEDGLPPGTTIAPGMPEPLEEAPEGDGFEGLDDSAFDMGDPNAWMNPTEDEPIDTRVSTKLDENGLDIFGNKPRKRKKGLSGDEETAGVYTHMNPDGSVDNSGLTDSDKYDITDDINYAGDKNPGDAGYLYMDEMYFDEGGLVEGRGSTKEEPIYNSNNTMQGGRSTMRGR